MSQVEVLNQLKKLYGKYQTPFGIAIWGFTATRVCRTKGTNGEYIPEVVCT